MVSREGYGCVSCIVKGELSLPRRGVRLRLRHAAVGCGIARALLVFSCDAAPQAAVSAARALSLKEHAFQAEAMTDHP